MSQYGAPSSAGNGASASAKRWGGRPCSAASAADATSGGEPGARSKRMPAYTKAQSPSPGAPVLTTSYASCLLSTGAGRATTCCRVSYGFRKASRAEGATVTCTCTVQLDSSDSLRDQTTDTCRLKPAAEAAGLSKP